MEVELRHRPPFDGDALLAFLSSRAVRGVEQVIGGAYRRSLRLPGGPAVIELRPRPGHVAARFRLACEGDARAAAAAARILFDLDCDPLAVRGALASDRLLGPLLSASPGLRVPGHPDPDELAVRAVLGQQISVTAAATIAAGLVARHGEPLDQPVGAVTHLFPTPGALAAIPPERLPMPRSRGRALTGIARALAEGRLELRRDGEPATMRRRLLALPGIGPWTAAYVEIRALGDRDAFPASDLGLRRALEQLGAEGAPGAAARTAEAWRPFRAYAAQYLWSTLQPKEGR